MLSKFWILVAILVLLLVFYIVISVAVGKKKNSPPSPEIKNYLFNVRVLVGLIALVSIILWSFL